MLLGLGLGWAGVACAALADQVGATFGLMLQDVVAAFPAVEGLVVSVDADRIYLDLTDRQGARLGQEFAVFRRGEVFRHPLTGKPLGHREELLGHAQVLRVFPQFSEARLVPLPGKPPVQAEDGARITRGRIRVAVPPATDLTQAKGDLRRVPFMIAHALSETRRFQSADPSAVQDLLLAQRSRSEELLVRPELAVSTARALDVAGWLVPLVLERRGVTYLDVTWVSGVTGTALFSRRLALTRADATVDQRFPWEPVSRD